MIFKLHVTMQYETDVEIEAESLEQATQEAKDMAGDGVLLESSDITNVVIE